MTIIKEQNNEHIQIKTTSRET